MKQNKIADKNTSLPDALNAFYAWFNQNASGVESPAPTAPDATKTKEWIINFRKKRGGHVLVYIKGAEVERVKSVKFRRVMITNKLSWTSHIDAIVKKAQQYLIFLMKFGTSGWKKLKTVVYTAETITKANFLSMDSIYTSRYHEKAANIIKDPSQTSNTLFQPFLTDDIKEAQALLADTATYQQVAADPTSQLQNRITQTLKKLGD
eukprot:g42213.t1